VHFHDSSSHNLLDAEVVPIPRDVVAFFEEFSGLTQQEACKGDVLTGFREFQLQAFVQLSDGDTGVNETAAIRMRDDGIDFNVMLVLDLANDLLDQVLHSHDPLHSSVFIDDDAHMGLCVLQHAYGVVHLCGVRDEHGPAQQLREPEGSR